jgi:hypothetical protein
MRHHFSNKYEKFFKGWAPASPETSSKGREVVIDANRSRREPPRECAVKSIGFFAAQNFHARRLICLNGKKIGEIEPRLKALLPVAL